MKKLILGCFLISGFAAAETSISENMETTIRYCNPEDIVFVSITTSCGVGAVASGCTTAEIVADTLGWEEFHCGPTIAP